MKDGLDRGDACDVAVEEVERGKLPALCQRNTLFRMPKAQIKGRLEMHRVPVRVAKCLKNGGDAATVLQRPEQRNEFSLQALFWNVPRKRGRVWGDTSLHYGLRKGSVVRGTEHDAKDPEYRHNKSF